MSAHATRPKTSTDILEERNELRARVEALESAMAVVLRETEHGLRNPEACVLSLSRIGTVARGVTEGAPVSAVRAKSLGPSSGRR